MNTSVHCLAGMLKRYFREVEVLFFSYSLIFPFFISHILSLPSQPPVVPYDLYGDVISKGKELFIKLHEKLSQQEEDESSSSSSLMDGNHPQFDKILKKEMLSDLFELIWSLPVANRTIFCWLMVCLFGVSRCEEETKMGPENIALVFGPNLMRFSANPTATESMKVFAISLFVVVILYSSCGFLFFVFFCLTHPLPQMLEDSSVITLITGVLIRHARDLFSFVKTKEEEQNQTNLMNFCPFEDNFVEGMVEKKVVGEEGEVVDEKEFLDSSPPSGMLSF